MNTHRKTTKIAIPRRTSFNDTPISNTSSKLDNTPMSKTDLVKAEAK